MPDPIRSSKAPDTTPPGNPEDISGGSKGPSTAAGSVPPGATGKPAQPQSTALDPLAPRADGEGVRRLLEKFSTPARLPAPVSGPSSTRPPPTSTSAQRSAAMPPTAFYADAGITSTGDSAYAGVALLKGSAGAGEAEVLGYSRQYGAQHEESLVMGHVTVKGKQTSLTVDAFTARANVGIHNSDGSVGFNVGAQLNAYQFETTHDVEEDSLVLRKGDSFTIGVSGGPGVEASYGVRDRDGDGLNEHCIRLGLGVTAGYCLEVEKK